MIKKNLSRRDFIKKTSIFSLANLLVPPVTSMKKLSPKSGVSAVSNIKRKYDVLDAKTFSNPGAEYRGVPLWFFNDKLDIREVVRQLRSIRYAGWGRVTPRRYSGLLDATYGREWSETIREVIKVCENLNMKVFLQEADKNGWYSAAPTPIPGMKDAYRNKSLVKRGANENPEKNETLITRIGVFAYYQHIAFPKSGWENSFCYLDLLDANVVSSYLDALFSFLHNEFGYAFGKTIEAVWVAEPHIMMGRVISADSLPWTTKLPMIFQKEWGYSLIENIPLLFDDIGDFQKVRYHYWRTLSNLLTQSYSKVMKEWCEKHKLKFVGHLMGEDSFISQLQYSVNVMPHYEYMDIPGIDHLTMDLYWPTGDPFILTPKQAASVANQLGIKEVLSEMYGTSDQGNSFEDRKRVYQWLGVLGINYRCYHGPFYSMRGLRKRYYPVNLNYQQPWWSENRIVADFAARLSYVLRQGQYKADILVIHSIESYYLEGKISRELSKKVGPLDMDLITLSHNLLKIQRSYDYGDETLLEKYGKIVKDNIAVGAMTYKVAILPSVKTLRKSTVKLLNEFLDAGGTVISVGTLPTLIDAEVDKKIDVFNERIMQISNDAEVLKSKLNNLVSPDIQVSSHYNMPAETIWIQHRLLDNGQIFFLTNIDSEKTVLTEVKIKGNGKLEYWNLENGKVEYVPQQKKGEYIITKLQFVPDGSHLLFLNESVSPENISEKVSEIIRRVPLKDFRVTRDDSNSMTLDFCRYKKKDGGWSDILPIMGVQDILVNEKYNGAVTLRFEFVSEIKPNRCAVVIEEAEEYFVTINGNKVKYNGLPYYRDKCFLPIDITNRIQPGTNYIEISRHFQAPERETIDNENLYKFYGTELEQIYLIGDFAVRGECIGQDFFEYTRQRYKPSFVITEESGISQGDLLADGYCFFNGTINLETSVNITNITENERYYIDIEKLDAVIAKIRINNRGAGKLAWRPYRLEITDYIWERENKIEISLTNSLRNLLGGLHFVPLKDVSGGQWVQKARPNSGDGPEWYKDRENNRFWSDDYFFRPFGIGGNVSVICERF